MHGLIALDRAHNSKNVGSPAGSMKPPSNLHDGSELVAESRNETAARKSKFQRPSTGPSLLMQRAELYRRKKLNAKKALPKKGPPSHAAASSYTNNLGMFDLKTASSTDTYGTLDLTTSASSEGTDFTCDVSEDVMSVLSTSCIKSALSETIVGTNLRPKIDSHCKGLQLRDLNGVCNNSRRLEITKHDNAIDNQENECCALASEGGNQDQGIIQVTKVGTDSESVKEKRSIRHELERLRKYGIHPSVGRKRIVASVKEEVSCGMQAHRGETTIQSHSKSLAQSSFSSARSHRDMAIGRIKQSLTRSPSPTPARSRSKGRQRARSLSRSPPPRLPSNKSSASKPHEMLGKSPPMSAIRRSERRQKRKSLSRSPPPARSRPIRPGAVPKPIVMREGRSLSRSPPPLSALKRYERRQKRRALSRSPPPPSFN